jgi:hypothetical protein
VRRGRRRPVDPPGDVVRSRRRTPEAGQGGDAGPSWAGRAGSDRAVTRAWGDRCGTGAPGGARRHRRAVTSPDRCDGGVVEPRDGSHLRRDRRRRPPRYPIPADPAGRCETAGVPRCLGRAEAQRAQAGVHGASLRRRPSAVTSRLLKVNGVYPTTEGGA